MLSSFPDPSDPVWKGTFNQVWKVVAKKNAQKKTFLDSLKDMVGASKTGAVKNRKRPGKKKPIAPVRDPLTPFQPSTLDMDVLLDVVMRMKEARSAAVLAEMTPDRAKEVTLQLADQRNLPEPVVLE